MENFIVRAGVVCVYNNKILLIHRINKERDRNLREYYVLPGGRVNGNEKIEEAAVREVKEETDLDVKLGDLICTVEDKDPKGHNRKHYYYLCEYVSGEPMLREDSEEAEEMKGGIQLYKPMWIEIKELENIILFPKQLKEVILNKFST